MRKGCLRGLIIGAPGSGKGTLTSWLARDFRGFQVISTGDALRKEILAKSVLGMEAENCIRAGQLVPDGKMVDLIQSILEKDRMLNGSANWLLDGFPRTVGQASLLDTMLAEHKCPLNHVIVLDVPFEKILSRVENRWVHMPSGRVYNLKYNPPLIAGRDDITGEKLVKRDDDNEVTLAKRLQCYQDETAPLIDRYTKLGLVQVFKGDSSDQIYKQLYGYIAEISSCSSFESDHSM